MGQRFSKLQKKSTLPDREPPPPPPLSTQKSSLSLPEGFKWIEGRAFNEGGNPAYPLPNDNTEHSRLNMQHYVIRFLINGYYKAPVHEILKRGGASVLDAGCGTGIWSIEMAQKYPESEFVGADLIDVFAKSAATAPPNVRFEIANILNLPYDDGQFDFVYQRFQTVCFKEEDWPTVFSELTRVLKPGGWLELTDADGWTHNNGPRTLEFYTKLHEFLKMRGINTSHCMTLNKDFEAAGLIDITMDHVSVPLGWGPEEIATPSAKNIATAMKSFKPQLLLAMGFDDREYDEMVDEAPHEFAKYRTYWNAWYVYGRKPVLE